MSLERPVFGKPDDIAAARRGEEPAVRHPLIASCGDCGDDGKLECLECDGTGKCPSCDGDNSCCSNDGKCGNCVDGKVTCEHPDL